MQRLHTSALLIATLALTACGSDDDNDNIAVVLPEPAASSQIRVIHASADAPMVNILANGNALLTDVDYAQSSGLLQVSSAEYDISVDAQLPGDETQTVFTAFLDAEADMEYTAVAVGSVADNSLDLALIENPTADIAADYARVQVLHGTVGVGEVDVYVTAVDADISMMSPTLSLDYMAYTAQIELAAGDYQIRITVADQKAVVYDSGTVALMALNDYFLTAVTNVWSGSSPVALLAALPEGQVLIQDKDAGAGLRVIHAVADAPAVDVFLDEGTTPAVAMLTFKQVTPFLNVPEGDHTVTVAANSDNSVVVIDMAAVTLDQGMSYSALAVGSLTENDIMPWVLMDSPRRIATAAKLNIAHASYSAGNVDIYLTATDDISDATPALSDVPFMAASGALSITAGDYVVSVTPHDSKTVAIGPLAVSLMAGGIYSVAAVDNIGGGTPLGVILMDDFTAK
ncbi:hypothetical protein CXF83_22195 [Shewanella sp. Choline-02u-19]|nr:MULTISPECIES: DUF4397 domain-containing protein [unclassified Shewanella]PKG75379.1 hypothetical protein CXF86_07640 [Shewanella sp. GutCb]PKH59340.1 hypothetical protein CXF84_03190 [Shewanella sp. Bg11-22]PKI29226.1 hypothetical protein CXF83_22195 [Shewanella sp. Choline-02u-19]